MAPLSFANVPLNGSSFSESGTYVGTFYASLPFANATFLHGLKTKHRDMLALSFCISLFFALPALSDPELYTFLTYNIRYDNPDDGEDAWPKRRDFLAAQIRFYAPDVIGIQEGLRHQVVYLAETLPEYTFTGVGRDDGATAGEYSAVFFRRDRFRALQSGTFWLSESPDTVSRGWDAALPRICTWVQLEDSSAHRVFWVFNTHFDHIGKEARRQSANLIRNRIAALNPAGQPVVLLGDLNSLPGSAPVNTLSETFVDAHDQSREPPFGPEGTFNGFRFNEPVTNRIDYIFTTPGAVVRQYAVLSDSRNCRYPSDHLPVLARVAF